MIDLELAKLWQAARANGAAQLLYRSLPASRLVHVFTSTSQTRCRKSSPQTVYTAEVLIFESRSYTQ